jgi:lysozyme
MSTASDIAMPIVKEFEKCVLTAYHGEADADGVWTIGWGHTGPEVHEGLVWTQDQADAALGIDLTKAEATVRKSVSVMLSAGQIAALIALVFNCGVAPLIAGTWLSTALTQRDWFGAVRAWIKWDHANKKEVRGLLVRRLAEARLFLESSP